LPVRRHYPDDGYIDSYHPYDSREEYQNIYRIAFLVSGFGRSRCDRKEREESTHVYTPTGVIKEERMWAKAGPRCSKDKLFISSHNVHEGN